MPLPLPDRQMSSEPAHRNNIGFLRITLASLVILSHSVELTDGSRRREPLTQLFHTVSLGDAALTGFFILSGYLISRSFLSARTGGDFVLHRVARIVPAFLVAFLVAILIQAPLLGLSPWSHLPILILDALSLKQPVLDGVHLNQPAWTIAFEFRCYMLTLALGLTGLLRHRRVILGLTLLASAAAFLTLMHQDSWILYRVQAIPGWMRSIGEIRRVFQFATAYLVGSCTFLFWAEIRPRLTLPIALAAFLLTVPLIAINLPMAYLALSWLGAPPLFWLAMRANLGRLQRINDRWDISYGTYLYGWIIQMLLVALVPSIDPVMLTLLAIPLAWAAGIISWIVVERRSKDWFRRRKTLAVTPSATI